MSTTSRNLLTLDDGTTVPRIGIGTWQLEGDTAYRAVRDALELGYRHVDTAQAYGNEAEVGRAIADSGVARDELFVTTKIWRDNAARDDVQRSHARSLDKLGLDHVDLLLLHWPSEEVAPVAETVGALEKLRADGHTRLIGVSNFPSDQFTDAAAAGPLVNNQVEFHVNLGQDAVLAAARDAGAFITAYSPLASGGDVAGRDVLERIADAHDAAWQQVAIAWLLSHDDVVAIPRSSNRDHLAANLAALELTLTDEDLRELAALPKDRRQIDPPFAPAWD